MPRSLLPSLLFAILFAATPRAVCQSDPALIGSWSEVKNLPYRPVHLHLLPSGKVMFFSYYNESFTPQIWDPVTDTFSIGEPSPYRLFCTGHSFLANGNLLVSSGHLSDYVGYAYAAIYDSAASTWSRIPDMNAGRWYPTNTTLANGDVLVTSGQIDTIVGNNPLPQVWQTKLGTWRNLTSAQLLLPLYPFMFQAPNGKVFYAGPSPTTRYLDVAGTGSWSLVDGTNYGWRDYGSAVQYGDGKILIMGGGDPPTASAEIIDLNAPTPIWQYTAPMSIARRQHNATLLPDGTVLVTGGSSGAGFDNANTAVLSAEAWDPGTGTWTSMASASLFRGYHSSAILLPDGRVLAGGGNAGGASAQVFSPPYLFKGARPAISSAPAEIRYGQPFFVGTPDATAITSATLIRLGSVTHAFDQNQRISRLSVSSTVDGVNLVAPANGNLAPPGHYMLFLLNSAGVPSVARILRLDTSAGGGTVRGMVTSSSGSPIPGAAVNWGSGSITTGPSGAYTITGLPEGMIILTASAAGFANANQPVTVVAGQNISADFVLSPAQTGAVQGKVTNAVNGYALAGVTITHTSGATTTDASGNYHVPAIATGSQPVVASKSGLVPRSGSVNVAANVTATLNFQLAAGGKIAGKVTDSTGTPINGALVRLQGGSVATDKSVTTTGDGTYNSNWIPIGNYTVTASASNYGSKSSSTSSTAGATSTVDFNLLAPAAGSGSITGKVTRIQDGKILAGATVSYSAGSTTTDSTGAYRLASVAAGTQALTAKANGYAARTLTATVQSGTSGTLNFSLATTGKVSGYVRTISGKAVGGAQLTISGGAVPTTGQVTTDAAGYYSSPWIPYGSYQITFVKSGFTSQTKSATVSTGARTTLDFKVQ